VLLAAESALADKTSSATDPSMTYSLTISTAARSASVRIAGDLDYETADDLVEVCTATSHAAVALHLDHRPQFLDCVLQVRGCSGDYRET
jgi:hypothetical protein